MDDLGDDATLMDVDDCLTNVVGAFGRYQIFICFVEAIYTLSSMAFALLPVFTTANITELQKYNPRVTNESSILYEFDLLGAPWTADIIQALYFTGYLFGVVILGQLSDKYGRKIIMQLGILILFPVYFVTSFSTSWEMFTAFRFLTGFISGGVMLVIFVYMQENIGRKWWHISSAIVGPFTPIGIMLYCLAAYYVPSWRHLVWILSVLQLPPLMFVFPFLVKESPRWLYSKNRIKEAEEVLVFMAKKNGVVNPVCKLKPLHVEQGGEKRTFLDVLKNPITLKRLGIMGYVWFVCSLLYYTLSLAAGELDSNAYVSETLMACVEMPIYILYPWVINRKWGGRKRATILTLLFAGISCLLLIMFKPGDSSSAQIALGLLGKINISFNFNVAYVYAPELFPTYVRNGAMGAVSMCARVGGILSSFADSFIQTHSVAAYSTFGVCAIAAGLLAILLPETLGTKPPNSFEDLIQNRTRSEITIDISSDSKANEKKPLLAKEDTKEII